MPINSKKKLKVYCWNPGEIPAAGKATLSECKDLERVGSVTESPNWAPKKLDSKIGWM